MELSDGSVTQNRKSKGVDDEAHFTAIRRFGRR